MPKKPKQPTPPTIEEATKAIKEAARTGNIVYANPAAEEAFQYMLIDRNHPEYGLFLDVDIRHWDNRKYRVKGITITWARKGVGFGEIGLSQYDGEGWKMDSESMGTKFVTECFEWFLKNKVEKKS